MRFCVAVVEPRQPVSDCVSSHFGSAACVPQHVQQQMQVTGFAQGLYRIQELHSNLSMAVPPLWGCTSWPCSKFRSPRSHWATLSTVSSPRRSCKSNKSSQREGGRRWSGGGAEAVWYCERIWCPTALSVQWRSLAHVAVFGSALLLQAVSAYTPVC